MFLEERTGQTELFPNPSVLPIVAESVAEYKIPRRTAAEDLSFHGGRMTWMRDFHRLNNIPLPKGFSRLTSEQSFGRYRGMLETYGIVEHTDIIKR